MQIDFRETFFDRRLSVSIGVKPFLFWLHVYTQAMPVRLRAFDLGVVAIYLVAITLFGLRFAKRGAAKDRAKDKTLRGYFLADKTAPWWAIALSIVSAETSTLTIISIPGVAFAGDFGFLQVVLGYMLGRVVVAALFLPKYFRGEMLTAYQLINARFSNDGRFGRALYKLTAGLFLLTRAAAEGVRVFAVSIVVGIAIGTGDVLSIGIISALTLLYTFEGGMAAVIWTDVVQMAIYVGGTLVAIGTLGARVGGGMGAGWGYIWAAGTAAGKFHMLNFAMNLTQSYTFWAGVLGGTFLTMASHGTDQLMVQRMLAARNLRESRLALLSSGVVIFVQFTLFLLIGVGLWVFYGGSMAGLASTAVSGMTPDRIFPTFIVREMPVGTAGLLVAAILAAAMSNLSAALNSLSSTTVVDFYMGWRTEAAASNPSAERERMLVSKASTVVWALVLFAIAVYSIRVGGKGHVVELGLSIASVAYGCLLGVFLLGTLTRYATQWGSIVGMVCGFAVNVTLWLQSIRVLPNPIAGVRFPAVAFTWYVLIGAGVTFAVGSVASMVLRGRRGVATIVALVGMVMAGALVAQETDSMFLGLKPLSRLALMSGLKPGPIAETKAAAQAVGGATPTSQNRDVGHPHPSGGAFDFSPVSAAIDAAIGEKKLPGAVVVVGHGGKVVFEQAYGERKLAGEPGLDGKPSAAEPMTVDTIFDMASLTKCLVTATAVMQLVEQGKVDVDAPVMKYLPEFGVNGKEKVTVRELLTHYSGLPPDVSLKDAWGLAKPDRAEGIKRAMEAKLESVPGTKFVYSDVNFITLGALVEKVSGERLDDYGAGHIFGPLKMTHTRFHSFDRSCGPRQIVGAAIVFWAADRDKPYSCLGSWTTEGIAETAPTQHDNEATAEANPDFDRLLRGTVHDPTTRRMGGVAGQAGVFSTAGDVALFAQALLDRLAGRPSDFPLRRETLELMTRPEQPRIALGGATVFDASGKATTGVAARGFGWDINSAYSRPRGEVFPIGSFGHTGFTGTSVWMDPASDTYVILLANSVHPRGGASISGLRGEVATAAARALGLEGEAERAGAVSPTHRDGAAMNGEPGGIGATTKVSDSRPGAPGGIGATTQVSDSRPGAPGGIGATTQVSDSRPGAPGSGAPGSGAPGSGAPGSGAATQVSGARPGAPGGIGATTKVSDSRPGAPGSGAPGSGAPGSGAPGSGAPGSGAPGSGAATQVSGARPGAPGKTRVMTGIDVLEADGFAELKAAAGRHGGRLRIGLLTNQTGVDAQGKRTIDVLGGAGGGIELVKLFSPEHGLFGAKDSEVIGQEVDSASGLKVTSLYGPKDSDKRPKVEDLKDLDAVVVDLQDAGVRFYTYETVVGYFLEASACRTFHGNELEVIVLDRPSLIGGLAVQGPVSDYATNSYINYMAEPVRHGMTLGELAKFMRGEMADGCPASNSMGRTNDVPQRLKPPPGAPSIGTAEAVPLSKTRSAAAAEPDLTVVPMQGWTRGEFFDQTGLKWVNPSPNLRSVEEAVLYPGVGMMDATNMSVGRGTAMPFEVFGAGVTAATASAPAGPQWFDGKAVAEYLTAREIPGVSFLARRFAVADDANKYPYHGQTIEGVRMTVTDRVALNSPELGIEIVSALHHLYPQFRLEKVAPLVANSETIKALERGDDPRAIAAGWDAELMRFEERREKYLMYR